MREARSVRSSVSVDGMLFGAGRKRRAPHPRIRRALAATPAAGTAYTCGDAADAGDGDPAGDRRRADRRSVPPAASHLLPLALPRARKGRDPLELRSAWSRRPQEGLRQAREGPPLLAAPGRVEVAPARPGSPN